MDQQYWIEKALELGFSQAVPLNIRSLKPRKDVRDMCASDKCNAYGKNWTCPPYCGTLEECEARMGQYAWGILLQTTGTLEKMIDTKGYQRTEQRHLQLFHKLSELVRITYPNALCLGSGGCRICTRCAYPAPCRSPEKAYSSMEGFGLFVTQVCRDSGCSYYYGEKTITYTACILFPERGVFL